jgi:hypothetical protein
VATHLPMTNTKVSAGKDSCSDDPYTVQWHISKNRVWLDGSFRNSDIADGSLRLLSLKVYGGFGSRLCVLVRARPTWRSCVARALFVASPYLGLRALGLCSN